MPGANTGTVPVYHLKDTTKAGPFSLYLLRRAHQPQNDVQQKRSKFPTAVPAVCLQAVPVRAPVRMPWTRGLSMTSRATRNPCSSAACSCTLCYDKRCQISSSSPSCPEASKKKKTPHSKRWTQAHRYPCTTADSIMVLKVADLHRF